MRIFSTTRRKLIAVVVTAGVALALVPVLHGFADWGPARTTFTWANPATYVTFNSITDNPQVGDERQFYGVADVNSTQYAKTQAVTDNEEVSLRIYYHNNAASNLNLVANNSRVRFALPTTASASTFSTAHITADNATPADVADTVDFTGARPFTLSYEPGTAQIWNNSLRGTQLSDSIVTSSGALIGFDKIDGKVPGCAEFSGYVTIKVRVHMPTPPPPVATFACSGLDVAELERTKFNFTAHATATNATVSSYVFTAKDSNGNVVDTKTVTTSDLSAQYAFANTTPGTYTISAVVNTDHGSTKAADCTKQVTVKAETPNPTFACTALDAVNVDRTHYDLTAHASVSNANVSSYVFTVKDSTGKVVDTQTVSSNALSAVYHFNQSTAGTYTVNAVVNTDQGSTNAGDCTKQVTVQPETPNPVPTFSCSALTVANHGNRAITATVTPVAQNGAALQVVNYDFGDGTTLMTDKTSADHTFAKDGTYTVAATLTFNVGDTTKTARCAQSVTITTPVTPQVLPATTTLPNTGPGDEIGAVFAGATALGAAGHYVVNVRRRR